MDDNSTALQIGHFERFESRREPLNSIKFTRCTLGGVGVETVGVTCGQDGTVIVLRVVRLANAKRVSVHEESTEDN